jgi:hypothetical protein
MKVTPLRIVLLALAGAGCTTVFPSAEQLEEAQLVGTGLDLDTLRRGRVLMVTTCQDCHRLFPPQKHLPAEWGPISERMGSISGLDSTESAAVGAYLEHAARWNQKVPSDRPRPVSGRRSRGRGPRLP